MPGHCDNRINLSFSSLEYYIISQIAKKVNKKPGPFCRDLILDSIGRDHFKLEVPEKGIVQLNLFLPKPKTKSFKRRRKGISK